MRTPTTSLLLAAGLVASLAMAPAVVTDEEGDAAVDTCRAVDVDETPDDATDDVTLCEQQLFVRAGEAPVSNLATAVFSEEAPAGGPVGGAAVGGSVTDIVAQGDPAHGLEVTGTFTGAVDSIDVEVWLLMPNGAANGSHGTTPTIELDGFALSAQQLDTTVEPGSVPGTVVARFSVEDLLSTWNALGYDVDPTVEHTIRLNLSPFYFGDDGLYLYDGTDVPSNVVLNAAG